MDIKNNLMAAYCAGYEAAKYDMNKDGMWEDFSDILSDARRWVCLMFKTGAMGGKNGRR